MRYWPDRVGLIARWVVIFLMASVHAYAGGNVLITEDEAKLPPPKGAVATATRGITRGPRIEYIADDKATHSPMRLRLKFEAFGGSKIDTESLKVTYLKNPAVDLTPRVKSFVQPTGIDMPDAVLPPGEHMLRVDVKDTDGRVATMSFTLKITQ